jgi:hypothetical protein
LLCSNLLLVAVLFEIPIAARTHASEHVNVL